MKITIMQGLPGSGKSTIARTLSGLIVSADNYPGLYTRGPDGTVRFDPSLLGAAHGACFRSAITAFEGYHDVVVDNTNLTVEECAPYFLLAQAYQAKPVLMTVICAPDVAFARQQHNVPRSAFDSMAKQFANFTAAFHWMFIPGFQHVVV
jgi:energy-coupling factor transporter ATP-binding protein EcfA2